MTLGGGKPILEPGPPAWHSTSRFRSTSFSSPTSGQFSASWHLQLGRRPLDIVAKHGGHEPGGATGQNRPPGGQNRATTGHHGPEPTEHPPTDVPAHHGPIIRTHPASRLIRSAPPFASPPHHLPPSTSTQVQSRSKAGISSPFSAGPNHHPSHTSARPKAGRPLTTWQAPHSAQVLSRPPPQLPRIISSPQSR